jgi:pyruvate/2-oxoglutarate dehydrogenase complex dihydrolipoamide dehydrogenase (E3) component
MSKVENYQVLVLGSGVAGKFVAWTMASAGHRTALVERGVLGGACPNVACLPSKTIIHSAKVASLAKRGEEFGLKFQSLGIDMRAVRQRKRLVVEESHQLHVDRTVASGADLVMGNARFVAPRTVQIDLRDGGSRTISGERVFLAMGSRAAIPHVPGLADAKPMTHVEALELDRVPEHLIVLGGGYVGLELSQAMRRFGSRVTLIEDGPQLAGREDPDVAAALLELFVAEGIEVLLKTDIRRIEGRSGDRVRVHAENRRGAHIIEGTDLLVATGRTPNTDGIGLELTGVELDAHGYVKVNELLQTTAENIWAMGDCAGSPKFTHVAFDDFQVAFANASGGRRTTCNRLVPFCLFTDPELARVGKNESEAQREGIEYRLVKLPFAEVLRTHTVSERRGMMKMLIGKDSDEILGFTAFGVEASELMAAVQTAMAGDLPYTVLRDTVFAHPTISEALNQLLAAVPEKGTSAAAENASRHGEHAPL